MQQDYTFILHNRCKCARCDDVIESKTGHDFKQCKCGAIFTDGGLEYIRRGGESLNLIIDMSEYRPATKRELLDEVTKAKKRSAEMPSSQFYKDRVTDLKLALFRLRNPNLV